MSIKFYNKKSSFFLSPMAGYTDFAFRSICERFGANTTTEMVSAKALTFQDKKSFSLIGEKNIPKSESIIRGVQLFGSEPNVIADAIKLIASYEFDFIDINAGCPMPKIFNNGAGSALLLKPDLLGKIVSSAVDVAEGIPVTVKIRSGVDKNHINATHIAKVVEYNGASAIFVHGRTREQYYSGKANLDIIRQVKSSVKIPVIGNGDILTTEDAERMFKETGCDGIAIGRGSLGNPFIFQNISEYFENRKKDFSPLSISEKIKIIIKQTELCIAEKGENNGFRELRKHYVHFAKGFNGAAKIRNIAARISNYEEFNNFISELENAI